jgi:hypothetical protein
VRRFLILQLALLLVTPFSNPARAEDLRWGTLKGTFVYDGAPPVPPALVVPAALLGDNPNPVDESLLVDATGGIANVVVCLRTKNVNVHPRALANFQPQVPLELTGARLEPHVMALLTRQTLVIRNRDSFAMSLNLMEIGGPGTSPLLVPGGQTTYQYQRAQRIPQPVTGSIHNWYKAYVLPRDNPYFAVSRADGSFEIPGLPLRALEFEAWHEKPGFVETKDWSKGRFKFDIKAGDNDLGVIKLDPKIFNK